MASRQKKNSYCIFISLNLVFPALPSLSALSTKGSIFFNKKLNIFRKPKRKAFNYPVSSDESMDKKTYVVIGFKLDRAVNYEHCLSFSILSHLLLGTSASPLRKALIDSQLGSEIFGGGFDDNRADTLFAVGLKGTEAKHEK